jgi:hypothetical protein
VRVVGQRLEREVTLHASGELLRDGALFNSEMQKIQSCLRFPRGLYRYKTHEEAERHWNECVVNTMVAVQRERHG